MTPQSSGWYDDPQDPTHLRYFDGVVWTEHRAPKELPPAPADPYADPTAGVPGASYGATSASAGGPSAGGSASGQGARDPYAGGSGIPQAPGWQAPGGSASGPQHPQYPQGGYGQGFPQAPGAAYGQVPYGVPMLHGRPLSGWWRRVGAAMIDGLLLSFVTNILSAMVSPQYPQRLTEWGQAVVQGDQRPMPTPDATSIVFALAVFAIFVAYDAVCVARWGRTLGHRLLGLRIVPVTEPGRLTMGASLTRSVVKHIAQVSNVHPFLSVLGLFNLVDSLFPLWDKPLRQSIHDKAAKSAVVRD